jgi:hypothetical protein
MKTLIANLSNGILNGFRELPEDIMVIGFDESDDPGISTYRSILIKDKSGSYKRVKCEVYDHYKPEGRGMRECADQSAKMIQDVGLSPLSFISYGFLIQSSKQEIVQGRIIYRSRSFDSKEEKKAVINIFEKIYPSLLKDDPDLCFELQISSPYYLDDSEWQGGMLSATKVFYDVNMEPYAAIIDKKEGLRDSLLLYQIEEIRNG